MMDSKTGGMPWKKSRYKTKMRRYADLFRIEYVLVDFYKRLET